MRFLLLLSCALLALSLNSFMRLCSANDSAGFFLKVAKNVPRLGRRSADKEFDSYFLKNIKTIPRIGKRTDEVKVCYNLS